MNGDGFIVVLPITASNVTCGDVNNPVSVTYDRASTLCPRDPERFFGVDGYVGNTPLIQFQLAAG
jgi:hypothetical protein